jgi:2-keto-4-pentenoate hydratase
MSAIDGRVAAALREQLRRRDAELARGATQIGWKLGTGRRERIGAEIAVGYLTSETVLSAGDPFRIASGGDSDPYIDAELCVELGNDLEGDVDRDAAIRSIARYWPALELVDLAPLLGEPDSVVATNVFHCAVAFGETPLPMELVGEVISYVNERQRDSGKWPTDIPDRIAAAARAIARHGRHLSAGDRIITGSITQVSVRDGTRVAVAFGGYTVMRALIEVRGLR